MSVHIIRQGEYGDDGDVVAVVECKSSRHFERLCRGFFAARDAMRAKFVSHNYDIADKDFAKSLGLSIDDALWSDLLVRYLTRHGARKRAYSQHVVDERGVWKKDGD